MTSSKSGRRVGFASAVSLAISVWAATSVGAQSPGAGSEPRLGEGIRIGLVTHVVDEVLHAAGHRWSKGRCRRHRRRADRRGTPGTAPGTRSSAPSRSWSRGASAIATSVPGDSMSSALNELIDSGIPVVQFNLHQAKVDAPYVGTRTKEGGRILGQVVVDQLGGRSARGTVVGMIGDCYPNYPVLQDRAAGVLESLDQAAVTGLGAGLAPPGLQIAGPLDVTYDPTTNYAAWQAALVASPTPRR